MKKRIAIVGSSGGNLYNQGGNDPNVMMKEIFIQTNSTDIEVVFVEFIGATTTMDNISMDSKARLYTLKYGNVFESDDAKLSEINELAKNEDSKLVDLISKGEVDGLIILSCDPKGVNSKSIKAAAEKKIPIVGTGGTSIANVQSMGARVISASGTTGTTNRTRAVAFTAALAKEWELKYMPVIGSSEANGLMSQASLWKRINFRGIMMASMPGFIAMAFVLALSKIPGLSSLGDVFSTLIGVLPVIVAAIAAKQVSGLDEVGIVAGVIAGILASGGGIIGGLVAGILAGILAYYFIIFCLKHKVPGTTANIAAGGLAGLVAGLLGLYAIAPVSLWLGDGIKVLIQTALDFSPILAGGLAGLLIWPAIIGGAYHAAILPIVLLEMESTGFSFLGAIDMTGLVMVSAGVTLANVISPKRKGDAAVALPGFMINIGFGTFVEAAYPFMFSSKLVFGGALLASTISGALVGMLGVKGTAYVPAILAPGLANQGHILQFAICMIVAMGLAFVFTVLANKTTKNSLCEEKDKRNEKNKSLKQG